MKHRDTREKILQAAEEVFARDGFAGARIHEISHKAGINQAMIYYYFSSKESLYQAVLKQTFLRLNLKLSKALTGNFGFPYKLRQLIEFYFDLGSQDNNLLRIMQQEFINGGEHSRQITSPYIKQLYSMVRKLFEEAIASGECRSMDIDSVLLAIFTLITFYYAASSMASYDQYTCSFEPDIMERRKSELTELILKGIKKNRG